MAQWPDEAITHLRRRWEDGASHKTIAPEVGAIMGRAICRRTVVKKAAEIGLVSRRFNVSGHEGNYIIELCREGKTDQQISEVTGVGIESVQYRVRMLVLCGLLGKRKPGRKREVKVVIKSCGIYDDAGRCMQYIDGADVALSEARVLAGRCRKRMTVWTMINDKGVDEKVAEVWPSGHMDMTFYGSALVGS